jgi:hypothetical protein
MAPMLRRRRKQNRTLADLARMLTALEESSRLGRLWAARRATRISLGRV